MRRSVQPQPLIDLAHRAPRAVQRRKTRQQLRRQVAGVQPPAIFRHEPDFARQQHQAQAGNVGHFTRGRCVAAAASPGFDNAGFSTGGRLRAGCKRSTDRHPTPNWRPAPSTACRRSRPTARRANAAGSPAARLFSVRPTADRRSAGRWPPGRTGRNSVPRRW